MQNTKEKEVPFSLAEAFGGASQTLVECLVASQQRNLQYSQSVFESTIELLKSHVASTHSLVEARASQQQEVLQQLMPLPGAWNAYVDLFSIPLAYVQQVLELLESVWRQGFGSFEQTTESFGHVTQQALERWQEGMRQIPPTTQPPGK